MVTNAIERAKKRVESHHFEMRKHLLEYDDVMNKQRKYIYMIRNEILDNADVKQRRSANSPKTPYRFVSANAARQEGV
ncbi:MAG: hypothetical protein U1F40_06185 [Turneriella sp.]